MDLDLPSDPPDLGITTSPPGSPLPSSPLLAKSQAREPENTQKQGLLGSKWGGFELPSSINPFSSPEISAPNRNLTPNRPSAAPQTRKRLANPISAPRKSLKASSNNQPKDSAPEPSDPENLPDLAKEAILEARDLLVKAYSLTSSRHQQSQLLDLLEVFREYTEKGKLRTTSAILANQIQHLETTTRKIEAKVREVPSSRLAPSSIKTTTPTTGSGTGTAPGNACAGSLPTGPRVAPRTYATLATSQNPETEWTTVTTTKKAKNETKPKLTRANNRLILVRDPTTSLEFSSLEVRNKINKAFNNKGVPTPVVTSVTKTLNKLNVVITTTSPFTADYLLDKQAIWEPILGFSFVKAQKDIPWHKVVLHGVSTQDFSDISLLFDEIRTFNKDLNPIGNPYWLTPENKRATQLSGSIVVSFTTEQEALRAIKNRLYIGGISVRVEKYYEIAPTSQCNKCQGFRHLESHCKRGVKCGLCANNHHTSQHPCNICHIKGQKCIHLTPKCANCSENHPSNYKGCETLVAIKNKAINNSS